MVLHIALEAEWILMHAFNKIQLALKLEVYLALLNEMMKLDCNSLFLASHQWFGLGPSITKAQDE